jgi:hypothetical protein
MVTPRKLLVTALVLGAGFSGACSGESTDSFDSQTLTRVDDAGTDGDCQNGGVKISTGLDKNKNGVLEDDEIDPMDVKLVCAGNMMATGDKPKLRRTDMLKKGDATCSAGGVAIHTGIDDNQDKKLEDKEIDETQYVCNSHPVVTRTTQLPVGDENCPFGGKEVAAGIDDGKKPDDGKLEDDEVDTTYFDCNSNPPSPAPGIEPPAGDPGTSVIDLTGGTSMGTGYGGSGGLLTMHQRDGSDCPPAITQIFPTGTVDASFKVPTFALDFGTEKFEIVDKISLELSTAVTPVNGTYYATPDGYIGRFNGSSFVPVTGLRIAAGGSLTLPVGAPSLNFDSDVEIQGTLSNTPTENSSLSINARIIVVGDKGVVECLQSGTPQGTLAINAYASMSLQGQIHAQGSTPNTPGAVVQLTSLGRLYLGGSINATGAADPAGSGASGGSVDASARIGGVWSTADINVSGGNGLNSAGIGGNIHLGSTQEFTNDPLDLRSSGTLKANGGSFTACPGSECITGNGGNIELRSVGADLLVTGALQASAGGGTVNVAQGGQVLFSVLSLNGTQPANVRIATSANITALGGAGSGADDYGGGGGTVSFENCAGQDSSMQFLGYSKVLLPGGASAGQGQGGSGGAITMSVLNADTAKDPRFYLYTPVDARGASGYTAGYGGGMTLELRTAATPALPVEIPSVVIAGQQAFSAGTAGAGGGGDGGRLRIHALGSVQLRDNLDLSAGTSDAGYGASGGQLDVVSQLGTVTNDATVSANGSSVSPAAGQGGSGGCIAFEGRTVNIAKGVAVHGGDAMGPGSHGGQGGIISLMSHGAPAVTTGKLDVAGGKGETVGATGQAGNDITHCVRRGD